MATSDNPEATDQLFTMGALVSDLKRLESKALSEGFLIAATLIGAAAEAVTDEMTDTLNASANKSNEDPSRTARAVKLLGSQGPQRVQ